MVIGVLLFIGPLPGLCTETRVVIAPGRIERLVLLLGLVSVRRGCFPVTEDTRFDVVAMDAGADSPGSWGLRFCSPPSTANLCAFGARENAEYVAALLNGFIRGESGGIAS